MLKKGIAAVLCAVLLLSGCGAPQKIEKSGKLNVVSVSFPGYSFAKEIAGGAAEVSLLLPVGTEAHSYEPTPKDMIKIQNADLFIYGGGESENWVKEVLSSLDKPIETVAYTDCAALLDEEVTEGMQVRGSAHETAHKTAHETAHDEVHHEEEKDEHVWTNPQNAVLITRAIAEKMCEKDEKNAALYEKNAEKYIKKLNELDKEFEETVLSAKRKEIIVGDRFPFLYLARRYGLSFYAAFPGCAGESEPSAKTIAFLIKKVKEDRIPVVFYTEFSNQKVAKTIAEASGAKPLLLHSCHNVSKSDFENGATYYSLMRENLAHIKEALN